MESHETVDIHEYYVDWNICQNTKLYCFDANYCSRDYYFNINRCVSHAATLLYNEHTFLP